MKYDIPFIILITIGILLILIGYLIKFRQKLWLVAGVSTDMHEITDKEKFASNAGLGVILLGIILFLMGIARKIFPDHITYIETIGLLLFLFTLITVFIRTRKYITSAEEDF